MEDRYAFSELIFDKNTIHKIIHNQKYNSKEESSVTLLIMGHGRERYKDNFKKIIQQSPDYYSEPFMYKVREQQTNNTVRILSKAGKPKICAWDYKLCTKNMSSQDVILELSHLFFNETNKKVDTFTLMNSLSLYFKTLYPEIIHKISRNYQDLPEDKNPGSPDADGYSQRYNDFNKVLDSLKENKFTDLKSLNHEKVFTVRPDNEAEYKLPCEQYHFEIVELRATGYNPMIEFITTRLKIRENLVKNYFSMTKHELDVYINDYTNTIFEVYSLQIDNYSKYYLVKFIFTLYFGNEILLSEIVEFFEIAGVQMINIIDNTCRVQERSGAKYSSSVKTSDIEADEQIRFINPPKKLSSKTKTKSKSKSKSKGGSKKKH
jgi:hypothetical protein